MTAIILTLTDAGLAALTNPAHTGTAALTISHIGLSQQHAGAASAQQALTALPGEFKRLETFGGEVLSPRTIHVFLRDESADAYSLRAFGLYASTGVLLAVVSSETPIMEKVPAATLLQAVDLTFARDIDAELVFGDTNFVNPPATTTRLGVVELATGAETIAGERQDLAVTPYGLGRALLAWAANFAAKVHSHAMGDIVGLGEALALKAHKDHKHDASDVNSGSFNEARIPELPMSRIAGLIATLGEKAQALHSHTMAQVSGLIDALATKATLGERVRFASIDMGTGNAMVYSESGDRIGVRTGTPADPRFFRFDSDGNFRVLGGVVFSRYGRVWDPDNFNPDTKASLGENASFRDLTAARNATDGAVMFGSDGSRWLAYTNGRFELTGLGGLTINGHRTWTAEHFDAANLVTTSATGLGKTGAGRLMSFSSPEAYGALPTGASTMVAPNQPGMPTTGYAYLSKIARRDAANGYSAIVVTHATQPGDKPEAWVGASPSDQSYAGWAKLWTDQNFDPIRVVPLRPGHGINSPDDCPEGISGGDANLGAGLRGYAFLTHHRLEGGYSAQLALPDTGEEVYVRRRSQGVWQGWNQIHTSATFNPADKASALHSHDWAQVTGKPSLATTDGTGVFFGAWNFGVAVRVNGSDWRYLPNDARVEEMINWRAASNAETLAGAPAHKFVSPAALWSFAKSIGPNGYQQIPGTDLIIQWGVSNGSHPEGAIHAALPVAFGGGCLFACATPRNAGQAFGMDFVMQIVGRYLDRIVFYANRANSSSGNMSGYEWMAVGLARGNPDPVYSSGGFPPGGGGGGGEIIP
nr:hypothetical protein [Brevundimonas diminuta]